MATVWIPSLMRDLTGGEQTVEAEGSTVRQVIRSLETQYPGMRARLLKGDQLRPGVSVAVDGIVAPLGLLEPVSPESEVHFLPAVAGGAASSSGV